MMTILIVIFKINPKIAVPVGLSLDLALVLFFLKGII
jgi:hypothetical protein